MVGARQVSTGVLLLLALQSGWSEKARTLRQFNAGFDASYSSSQSGSAMAGIKVKECQERPQVEHARVRCAYSGCRMRCDRGYKLATGRASMVIKCDHHTGGLTLRGHPWNPVFTPCLPGCGTMGCLNGGKCVAPGVCECAAGFTGVNCQEEEELQQDQPQSTSCTEPQFPVIHASVEWSGQQAVVRCHPGFSFIIGGTSATIQCRAGAWDLPPSPFKTGAPLACHSECEPPCDNGGNCLPGGVCDCPTNFWGPQCQMERCLFPRIKLQHSSLGGTLFRLKVECHPGYKMATGRLWQTLVCRGGQWTLPGRGLMDNNDLNCYQTEEEATI